MKLLLPIEIHVAVCELQATLRPTIAGILLQNCVFYVSLLRGVWNSGAAPAGVHRGAAIGFCKVFKITYNRPKVILPVGNPFKYHVPCSGFVFIAFVMYITTTTMCDGVLHCLWFVFNVFLVSLHGD